MQTALASADMVITSGGVSVGPRDYTPQIVDALGKPGIVVYGIAVKPGKPTTVGFVGEKPVFSLPGHPTSALLIFYLLARPLIQQLAGSPVTAMKTVKALAGSRMFSAKGRRTFVMVKLEFDKNCRLIASQLKPAFPEPSPRWLRLTGMSRFLKTNSSWMRTKRLRLSFPQRSGKGLESMVFLLISRM